MLLLSGVPVMLRVRLSFSMEFLPQHLFRLANQPATALNWHQPPHARTCLRLHPAESQTNVSF